MKRLCWGARSPRIHECHQCCWKAGTTQGWHSHLGAVVLHIIFTHNFCTVYMYDSCLFRFRKSLTYLIIFAFRNWINLFCFRGKDGRRISKHVFRPKSRYNMVQIHTSSFWSLGGWPFPYTGPTYYVTIRVPHTSIFGTCNLRMFRLCLMCLYTVCVRAYTNWFALERQLRPTWMKPSSKDGRMGDGSEESQSEMQQRMALMHRYMSLDTLTSVFWCWSLLRIFSSEGR